MYSDVNVAVLDGNAETGFDTGTGTQVKIGISNVESITPVLITGSMGADKIKAALGETPLADACMDAVEWGAQKIYAVPVKASTPGTVGTITHTGTGMGSVAIEGQPNNSYHIIIKIVEPGNTNQGTWQYSIDGGTTFGTEQIIPLGGETSLSITGLKVTFTAVGEGTAFLAGDSYAAKTTAPLLTNESVLKAVENLINQNFNFELVHIVGQSTGALWASLSILADELLTKHKKPAIFLLEAAKAESQTLEEYVAAMAEARKSTDSIFLQAVCSQVEYIRMDGRVQEINPAGIITGLYSRAKESQSIGEVKAFPLTAKKIKKILPEGIEDYLEELDKAGYLTLRQYEGKEHYYVTSANMLAPKSSNYQYAEDVRVLIRLIKEVRNAAIEQLQRELDPEDLEADLAAIEEEINIPLEDAQRDKIISSGRVTIVKEDVDILGDEFLNIQITYVPKGHIRMCNLTFQISNPYTE